MEQDTQAEQLKDYIYSHADSRVLYGSYDMFPIAKYRLRLVIFS